MAPCGIFVFVGERKGEVNMTTDGYVLDLCEVDETKVADVGGKGAHLGELARIEGVRVPAGFCVTAAAFRRIMTQSRVWTTCFIGWRA